MSDGMTGFLWGVIAASMVWPFVGLHWEAKTRATYKGIIEEYRQMLPANRGKR